MTRPLTLTAVAFLLAAACQDRSADPVILRLGAQELRRSEFDRHLAAVARRADSVTPELRQALLEPFLEERIVVLEARNRGLVAAGAAAETEQAAVQTLLTQALPANEIPEEEIAAYYAAHTETFRHPPSVTLSQILVATENEARDVRRRVQRDPKAFDILARTRSRAPEASTGGHMGTFEPGQLPSDLEAPAFAIAVGTTSEVVKSPLGYHVLRADARAPAREDPLSECRAQIRTLLLREKEEAATRVFVQQLLSRAKVNHEAALRLDRRL